MRAALASPAILLVAVLSACGGGARPMLTRAQLQDPAECQSCHPQAYAEWAGSMHAYAAEDPVFLAMNARAQRETSGAVGTFCVNCHAPLAVREGLTTDGLNLATLPAAKKGVTCYFCHATASVEGSHDAALTLAKDDALFGPFGDGTAEMPHRGVASPLFDDTRPESAAACGACHDIVNQHGAAVERTFKEWSASLFSKPRTGVSCAACHMDGSDGPASTISTRTRRLHRHDFPGVDLAVTPFPDADGQRVRAQALLDSTLQSTLCWNPATRHIEVTLDNVGAGHGFPSGATPDRRAWVEVQAFAAGAPLYASGTPAARPLEGSADPDLWLVRDCLFDAEGAETHLFWQAARLTENGLPGAATADVNDPASYASHRQRTFPSAGAGLAQAPDRITLAVHLQAIGDDVLAALEESKDLDPAVRARVARFELAGAALEWTTATAKPRTDGPGGLPKLCVTSGVYNAMVTPAESHVRCAP